MSDPLTRLEAELADLRRRLDRGQDPIPDPAHWDAPEPPPGVDPTRIEELLASIEALVERIAARRDEVAGRLDQIARRRQAEQAYRPGRASLRSTVAIP